MTTKELQKLIDRKIQETYKTEELSKSSYPNANDYYDGVRRGLKDVKQYIGMIGKNNKIRKQLYKNLEISKIILIFTSQLKTIKLWKR